MLLRDKRFLAAAARGLAMAARVLAGTARGLAVIGRMRKGECKIYLALACWACMAEIGKPKTSRAT
jgi:hypothetical protein